MDTSSLNPQSNTTGTVPNTEQELAHVTKAVYKKNFELAEKNKTLSLLRKIDEIIFSKVTDIATIAQQVVNVVAEEAEFKAVAIYLVNKDTVLTLLALSQTPLVEKITSAVNKPLYPRNINLNEASNCIAASVREKAMKITHEESEILVPYFSEEEIKKIKEIDEIKSSLIFPLIVRDNPIGALTINLGDSEEELFQYQQDLVSRLSGVIAIAIDNALLYQRIEEANERLKSLDKLKDEFVSLASHELRTPMTAVKSYVWLVLQQKGDLGTLTEKQKSYLDKVYISTERLIKLVNEMLNVSRIESGRMAINLQQVDLVLVTKGAISEVLPTAENLHISVHILPPAAPLPPVIADLEKTKEVFINLIGNSLKFTPQGGSVTISFEQKDNMIFTSITDNGKGILAEDMPKLFKKFDMIERNYIAISTNQGTGLGLYITKSIVELQGGTITVKSDGENKGTTFTFSLLTTN